MNQPNKLPKIEEKTEAELNEILAKIKASSLPDSIKDFTKDCITTAIWFPHILQKKDISLSRLKTMLFGKGYNSKKKNSGQADPEPAKPELEDNNPEASNNESEAENLENPAAELTSTQAIEADVNNTTDKSPSDEDSTGKNPGHGRMAHTVYKDFTQVLLEIEGLNIGDKCPVELCNGKLYEFEPQKPRVLVRIKGQNFADVYKYVVERFRCNLCGLLIQADIPKDIGKEKYDPSFKALLALQKYYVAVPFYRQEAFQRTLNFPLPDSTQWDLVEKVAGFCYRPFAILITYAANGGVIHTDDTRLRILDVIQKIKENPDTKRKGMFTTGMIAEYEGHRIALFLNGTNHAGENLENVLEKRDPNKPPIIQMCDALSCNVPKDIETIVSNCVSHAFRKFDELVDYFPTPCITIMKLLSQAYENEELTKTMSPQERLEYHQKYSGPAMAMLSDYLQALFDEKLVEPNSEMGKAIAYMQRHWPKLTRFLKVAGAPLCNNIVERALKIAIRVRKSAMFYRSCYSAHIGGMLTSLIYTCELAQANPHHYLTSLQSHGKDVFKMPELWLPWNYQDRLTALAETEPPANLEGCQISQGSLAVK
jgi:transposase